MAEVDTKAVVSPAGVAVDEREFASLVRRHVGPFSVVKTLMEPTTRGGDVARRAFAGIQQRAEEFVSFLDDHGARSNRTYAPLAEYAASVRGFAKMGRHLAHLEARLDRELPLPLGHEDRFRDETRRTLEFVKWSLTKLEEEALAEAGRLLGETVHPPPDAGSAGTGDGDPNLRLPSTLDEAAVPEPDRWIAEIASKFLAHKRILDRQSGFRTWADDEEMRRFVLEVSDEQQVRFYMTRMLNVLSRYDTYIQGTSTERQDPELMCFRSFVVTSLHLLEVMAELVHFYERHENEVRSETAKDRIADLVDKQMVLDRILNYGLNFLHVYMDEIAPQAETLVERYTRQTVAKCVVPDGVVLHARPVSLIARIVDHYGTPVQMSIGNTTCYAGSILQVLMAAGQNPTARQVTFEGDSVPLEDLCTLFSHGLGENDAPLPKRLGYLAR
ncbi:MAG: hypothetical protein HRU14_12760 [Planctomycetes bacterium]|nr:hypothetical protein [Planctomycetota bacterium]